MPESQKLLKYLTDLTSAQFDEVLFILEDERLINLAYIPSGAPIQKGGEVVRLLKQSPQGLTRLESILKKILNLSDLDVYSQPLSLPLTHQEYGNYERLQALLERERWEEADDEAREIVLKTMGKDKELTLYRTDIRKFPCQNLNRIDQLWIQFSRKRFGFSVQKQIWENIVNSGGGEETWLRFLNSVRWDNSVVSQNNAPEGHYPRIGGSWFNAYEPGWLEQLFARVEACKE